MGFNGSDIMPNWPWIEMKQSPYQWSKHHHAYGMMSECWILPGQCFCQQTVKSNPFTNKKKQKNHPATNKTSANLKWNIFYHYFRQVLTQDKSLVTFEVVVYGAVLQFFQLIPIHYTYVITEWCFITSSLDSWYIIHFKEKPQVTPPVKYLLVV